jgi:hypothetical protein
MPRYYFHIRDAPGVALDDEGAELTDLDAARDEARASARDLLSERLKSRNLGERQTIEIADASGTVLETLAVEKVLN